jgi:hypothetical protein
LQIALENSEVEFRGRLHLVGVKNYIPPQRTAGCFRWAGVGTFRRSRWLAFFLP